MDPFSREFLPGGIVEGVFTPMLPLATYLLFVHDERDFATELVEPLYVLLQLQFPESL